MAFLDLPRGLCRIKSAFDNLHKHGYQKEDSTFQQPQNPTIPPKCPLAFLAPTSVLAEERLKSKYAADFESFGTKWRFYDIGWEG